MFQGSSILSYQRYNIIQTSEKFEKNMLSRQTYSQELWKVLTNHLQNIWFTLSIKNNTNEMF